MLTEGTRGLYRGYTVTAVCVPFFNMIYFPLYETIKNKSMEKFELKEDNFLLYAMSASLAGSICCVISNPLWLVRTRMQAESFRSINEQNYRSKYPLNIFRTLRIIQQREGVLALYQGLTASMFGVFHPLIYFPLYEKSKLYFKRNWDPESESLRSRYVVICACGCKAVASACTYPHEVIRARM